MIFKCVLLLVYGLFCQVRGQFEIPQAQYDVSLGQSGEMGVDAEVNPDAEVFLDGRPVPSGGSNGFWQGGLIGQPGFGMGGRPGSQGGFIGQLGFGRPGSQGGFIWQPGMGFGGRPQVQGDFGFEQVAVPGFGRPNPRPFGRPGRRPWNLSPEMIASFVQYYSTAE